MSNYEENLDTWTKSNNEQKVILLICGFRRRDFF